MLVLQLLQLVPSRRLVDWNKMNWLIEGKWSCYSCCNSSPPAGSWTETEEIDWLKENGRVTVAATRPLPQTSRRLVDWKKERLIYWSLRQLVDRNKRDQGSICWWKMVMLHILRLNPTVAHALKQKRLIVWWKVLCYRLCKVGLTPVMDWYWNERDGLIGEKKVLLQMP